ncbi:MAG: HAMP domain-containing sensor histidine kinase [Pseudomonadales bacterium]
MRLAQYITANVEPILAEWESFAGSLSSGAEMTKLALRDDAEAILLATARDMQAYQSLAQQESKAKGDDGAGNLESNRLDNASELHGEDRVGAGFNIMEVVSEYRALRASVLRLWRDSLSKPDHNDIEDISRFNESMDQSLAKAVSSYTNRIDQSRRMFLAILSHDLRNPLNSIRMAARLVSETNQHPESADALSAIETNSQAIVRLIDDLIDFTSTGLGSAMPLMRGSVDLEKLCREIFEGFRYTHSHRTLRFHPNGDLIGDWDEDRLRQIISNLMSNALEHGSSQGAVEISVTTEESTVVLSVHNEGAPIPPDMLTKVFDPLVRHVTAESTLRRDPGSIGLGLYIVREIVLAHGGTIKVASTAQEGTRFTVYLPRQI